MNLFVGIGRLTRDVEVKEVGNLKIGKFTIAIQRSFKNAEGEYDTDYFNCVLFNASDYVKDNLIKGTLVSVNGRLQNQTYTDSSGKNRTATEVVVNKVNVLVKKENQYDKASIKTEVQEQFDYKDEDYPF